MSPSSLSPSSLHELIQSGKVPMLVHVLSDEAYAEKRIPGSAHACVYEVAFLDAIGTLLNDKTSALVVYGLNDSYGAAALAIERLQAAGYSNVQRLAGGLDVWESEGHPVEGEGTSYSIIKDGNYAIDPAQSVFRWTGRNLFNQHNGRIGLLSGQLEMQDGQLLGGSIVLDMTKISCSDLKDESMAKGLVAHLESDDFFSVSDHPRAQFKMTSAESLVDLEAGDNNVKVFGALTLKSREQLVAFPAKLAFLGDRLGLQGQFDVDRTQFGSVYGSGKIFEKLGQHLVNDAVSVSFQLLCSV
jgi:polyisoprenoid-binding protein YceI/rhodanese-related sulfurtransferase